ncbi:hypothetical protein ACA910_014294 [Epithemia clementina (nom. ined.)]
MKTLFAVTSFQFLAVLLTGAFLPSAASSRFLRMHKHAINGGKPIAMEKQKKSGKIEELTAGTSCVFYEQHAESNLADDMDVDQQDATICSCELDDGHTFILELPSDSLSCKELMKKKTLKTAVSRVQLKKGSYIDHRKHKIVLPKGLLSVDNTRRNDIFQHNLRRSLAGTARGSKTFLAVKIVAKDPKKGGAPTSITHTESQLSDRIFGISGDQVNLKRQFEACSQGIYKVEPASVGDPVNDQYYIQNGVVTVDVDTNITQGRLANTNAAIEKLRQMFNLGRNSPRDILANYFLFCMPPETATDGDPSKLMNIAVGSTGGWQTWFRGDWCTYPSAIMHEIGHNHYLGHASEESAAYGDTTGAMGTSIAQQDSPKFCFNAAQMYDLGWYDPSRLVEIVSPPNDVLDIKIVGFVEPFASGTTLVKIVNPLYPGALYTKNIYLHLNSQKGHNSGTQEGGNKVTIVEKVENAQAATKLIGKLDTTSAPVQVPGFFSDDCVLKISVPSIKITRSKAAATVRVQNVCL